MAMTTRTRITIMIGIFFAFVLFMLLVHVNAHDGIHFFNNSTHDLNDQWQIEVENEQREDVRLPCDLKLPVNTPYRLSRTLPDDLANGDVLLIRASMQTVRVQIDDRVVLHEPHLVTQPNRVRASLWHMVELSEADRQKTITIDLQSPVSAFSGKINPISYGKSHDLLIELLRAEFIGLITSLLLYVIGVLLIVIAYREGLDDGINLVYLGFVAIAMSYWIVSETKVMQLFTDSRLIIGSISYVSIPIIAASLIMYIRESIIKRPSHKRVMLVFACLNLLSIGVIIALQWLAISPLLDTMRYVFFAILIYSCICLALLCIEFVQDGNEAVRGTFKYIVILGVALIVETILFYSERYFLTSHALRIAILIAFVLALYEHYHYFKEMLLMRQEQALLKKWAYKDLLTDGYNRNAYERDLEVLLADKVSFRLVLADINNLKLINDCFGHHAGDQAIQCVAKLLRETFSTYGNTYRIGGDELAVLINWTDAELYGRCLEAFEQALIYASRSFPVKLQVAIGSEVYDAKTWPQYAHFYHHVDDKMYSNKLIKKQA